MQALFQILIEHPEGLPAKRALEQLAERLVLTDCERGTYQSSGDIRFFKIVRFTTIDCVKAEWILKSKGVWTVTDEGVSALASWNDPEEFYRQAQRRYRQWKQSQPAGDSPLANGEYESEEKSQDEVAITFERAEETAWDEIEQHVRAMPPFEFQDFVADLLRAMGYFVHHIAPPGKDGGIDIIAFTDPLGAHAPRIKVQVKRMSARVDVSTLKSFIAMVNGDDLGLYVSAGGFTRDAEDYARGQEQRKITLIDLDRLVELWIEHYAKLADNARRRLPLTPIYFLTPPA